jgi:hypothetical protein
LPVPRPGEDNDELIEQALHAYRTGDVDRLDAVGDRLRALDERRIHASPPPIQPADSGPSTVSSRAPAPLQPNHLTVAQSSSDRARGHSEALLGMAPNAAADERVLTDLVVDELPLAFELRRLELELAARIGLALDNPGLLTALARAMRELTALSGSVTRRIQGSLGVAANLRAQRRLITGRGSLDDV